MASADSAEELKRLQRCMSDLVSVLALPAVWSGQEPRQIMAAFHDALVATLNLDFLYTRVKIEANEDPIDVFITSPHDAVEQNEDKIRRALDQRFGEDPRKWPAEVRVQLGGRETSLLSLRLGLNGEIGIVVAACERPDFPTQSERLLLGVAANQVTVGLQQARLLSEQRRMNAELDARVAERTRQQAETNDELRSEIAKRKLAEKKLRDETSELRRTQARSKAILDSAFDCLVAIDHEGRITEFNPAAERTFGYLRDEVIGKNLPDVLVPPSLREKHEQGFARYLATGESRVMGRRVEMEALRADGRQIPVELAITRIDLPGPPTFTAYLRDITDRKRAEQALRASEIDLRRIIDSISGLVCTMTPEGVTQLVNRPIMEYFGKTFDELQSWTLGDSDAVHADDLPRVISEFRHSIATGAPFDSEVRLRRFDGVYRWFHNSGRPVQDADGKITGWYFLITDIDDRKRAEQALRTSERNLALTINTIPALTWSARTDGTAESFNQYYLQYVGLTQEQALGWGWADAVHPDDLSSLFDAWQLMMKADEGGECEARLRRYDGEYRWFLFRTNPLRDDAGKTIKWYGTNTDIDDRKRAEEELRRSKAFLVEGQRLSKTGSFFWRVATEEIVWSEQLYRVFELDPGLKLTLQRIGSRIHPEDQHVLYDMVELAKSGNELEYEYRLLLPDNTVKYLHVVAHGTKNKDGQWEFVGAVQDVTERRLSEEALDRARSELANIIRVTSLGMLTASIAHEVNQPLSGIITNASTCLRMLSSDQPNIEGARETARRTIRDGNRASEVVSRLRALFKKKEIAAESVDLNDAAREVIALSLSELQGNRIMVRYEFEENLPPVKGDRIQLQQVILNLLRNASDAMRDVDNRPRELLISTVYDDDKTVRLAVQDSGTGFAPDTADRLFESFYTTKQDGMGIGLSVSRSIIEAHRGRLWASPNEGPGSCFAFSIPCDYSAEPD